MKTVDWKWLLKLLGAGALVVVVLAVLITHIPPHWGELDDCVVLEHYSEHFTGLAGLGDDTSQTSLKVQEIKSGDIYGIPVADVSKYPVGTIIPARWKRK